MKNKSKLKKKQAANSSSPAVTAEWLYLADHAVTVRDIAEAFENPDMVEIWEEAGVAEVILGEKASMDMEWIETDLGEEEGNRFLETHQIQTVFMVTIPPQEYEKASLCMKKITEKNGGFFCGDNKDFAPTVQ